MAKTLKLDDIYPHVEKLETSEQIALRDFIQKTLDGKAEKAAEELKLINPNIQSN